MAARQSSRHLVPGHTLTKPESVGPILQIEEYAIYTYRDGESRVYRRGSNELAYDHMPDGNRLALWIQILKAADTNIALNDLLEQAETLYRIVRDEN